MAENIQTIKVGSATITVVDVYTIPWKVNKEIVVPEAERTSENLALLDRNVLLPVNCVLIQVPGNTVLVDAGVYEASMDHSGRTDYVPPTGLFARLAEAGVEPADIRHVVITHAHGDHYNATTANQDGRYVPTFPNAQVYFGKADLELPTVRDALKDPISLDARTIGVLESAGRIVPVEGDRDLGSGVTIVPSPGETPGHVSVRVRSEGKTLYCVGDLYHLRLEVDHPTWFVPRADSATILASRASLARAALAENALVIATHINGIGRVVSTPSGVTWATA